MIDGTEELKRENELLEQLDSMTLSEPLISPFNPNLQDPLLYMGGWLNNKDLSAFSRSCHQTIHWTKHQTDFRAASILLDLVVKGNQEGSMRLLQGNSGLLLNNKCSAIDYSGKTIQGLTAFQAALCAGDVEMCLMMKKCVNTLKNGPELLKQQYDTLFSQGIKAYSQDQAKATFDFSDIITAILNAQDDEIEKALNKQFDESKPLHKALSTFRAAFDTLSRQTQVFNPWHLHKALTLYDKNFYAAQLWNKRDLIWRQVVGYTQRHLPACYAQAFAQGLYNLVEDAELLQRGSDFRFSGGRVFPLGRGVDLGFDFVLWRGARRGGPAGTASRGKRASCGIQQLLGLENLLRTKKSNLERAFQPAEKPQLLVCSVLK